MRGLALNVPSAGVVVAPAPFAHMQTIASSQVRNRAAVQMGARDMSCGRCVTPQRSAQQVLAAARVLAETTDADTPKGKKAGGCCPCCALDCSCCAGGCQCAGL